MMLAGPTILTHGNDDQKARYLRPIVSGEIAWCQLFSEPGAGSDLASLQTKAVKDGDEWIVNGQKVWTSGGHVSEMGMLIARTNPDAPKHEGITWFAIEMEQPGIEVVPLREMTGRALFNEVFLSDARVRDDAIVGGLNQGWAVANTTLTNERIGLGGGGGAAGAAAGPKGGALQRRAGDLVRSRGGSGTSQALAGRGFGTLKKLAEEFGKAAEPTIRQDLAAALHARADQPLHPATGQVGAPTRSRGVHGQAPGESHHPPLARGRTRHPRPVRDAARRERTPPSG